MTKYIKKPITIEANPKVIKRFHTIVNCKQCGTIMSDHGWVFTLEGGFIVCPGDYIITGIQGENYPCKPDIFLDTYYTEDEFNKINIESK